MSTLFFFNDTATTEIYTLSLHDALPILSRDEAKQLCIPAIEECCDYAGGKGIFLGLENHGGIVSTADDFQDFLRRGDRKSTRLNSSHSQISYAVFCLKKKKHYVQSA